MKKALKKILSSIGFYIITIAMWILPILLVVLLFDYLYNFQIDLFDEGSGFLRIILAIWVIIIHGFYIHVEFGEKIKKYL